MYALTGVWSFVGARLSSLVCMFVSLKINNTQIWSLFPEILLQWNPVLLDKINKGYTFIICKMPPKFRRKNWLFQNLRCASLHFISFCAGKTAIMTHVVLLHTRDHSLPQPKWPEPASPIEMPPETYSTFYQETGRHLPRKDLRNGAFWCRSDLTDCALVGVFVSVRFVVMGCAGEIQRLSLLKSAVTEDWALNVYLFRAPGTGQPECLLALVSW